MGRPLLNKMGMKFGMLTAIKAFRKAPKIWNWLCKCDCGNETIVRASSLKSDRSGTKSCGCLIAKRAKLLNYKHGMCFTGEYHSWRSMLLRTTNKQFRDYPKYGGRGIGVCDRWRSSFSNFFEDMGRKPSPEHSLDRIDNNKGYFPANCRWATPKQQGNNTRSNVFVTWDGKNRTIQEWEDETQKPIRLRLRRGWSIERAFSQPKQPYTYKTTTTTTA